MSKTRTVITLGSFDGVHRGHQAILRKVVSLARSKGAKPVALVFNKPPRLIQNPEGDRALLTTFAEKRSRLKALGIQKIQTLEFDRQTSSMTPEQFFKKVIVDQHQATAMVVGPRMAFGKNRAGTLATLHSLGDRFGVNIHSVSLIGPQKSSVSSSRVRDFLRKGEINQANQALGYAYFASGKVVRGEQRGRSIGFPTLNVEVQSGKILPPGVFWVKVSGLTGNAMDAVCNVGIRPTFHPMEKAVHVEVHIWGKTLPASYGRTVQISFLRRLRSEKRFTSARSLIRQIERDVTRAKRFSYNPGE